MRHKEFLIYIFNFKLLLDKEAASDMYDDLSLIISVRDFCIRVFVVELSVFLDSFVKI